MTDDETALSISKSGGGRERCVLTCMGGQRTAQNTCLRVPGECPERATESRAPPGHKRLVWSSRVAGDVGENVMVDDHRVG